MILKRTLLVGALALGGACASGRTLSGTVSDEQLARVPAGDLSKVNAARTDLAKANDAVARQNLAIDQARSEVDVANREVDLAKAKVDKAEATQEAAKEHRSASGERTGAASESSARRELRIAQEHVRAAQADVTYATAERDLAQRNVELSNARLESVKYGAVKASGDPVAQNIDGQAIQKRIDQAKIAVDDQATRVVAAKNDADSAKRSWAAAQGTLGLGGSGPAGTPSGSGQVNSGSSTR